MRCEEFEEIVVQLAREEAVDPATLQHAAGCAHCAARLQGERRVTAALRMYKAGTADTGAPPRVEDNLAAAFRRSGAARRGRRNVAQWPAWASAFAAGVAVFAIAVGLQPRNPDIAPAAVTAEQSEVATDYFPLQYGTDLTALEGAPVVRMEFPRTVLASFGLPMNPERAGEPVQADVVLGRDGIARAVRFVQ